MTKVYITFLSVVSMTCSVCVAQESVAQSCCDEGGYYFDRGGRRVFETSYKTYERGTFNLRRGRVWREKPGCQPCRHYHKMRSRKCNEMPECPQGAHHEHYMGTEGMTRWPSAPGPKNGYARTKGYPNPTTPIWLRDPNDGYATPTSWQGFQ